MTEFASTINYEKHFLVNCLALPLDMCNIIKDYLFYNVEMSKKIHFMRLKKQELVLYFEETMLFYNSVACHMCGEFQMTISRNGVETHISNIHQSVQCKCGEYSMWVYLWQR